MFRFFSLLLLIGVVVSPTPQALAQTEDSTKVRELEEVVVTATRNERTMGALPMSVTLIQSPMLKTMGSVRLNDVLTEQTGLVVVPQVNAQGNGIQVQGFNPDYTLILMDGEPIIGRYTGSLELSRLTVGNIKQVEIVKGPSSSLYGSDALAGVINIITERPKSNQGNLSARYGANNTLDLNASAGLVGKSITAYLFGNRYSTDGYNLSPQPNSQTVSPFWNNTFNSKISLKLSDATELLLNARYFEQLQNFDFEVINAGRGTATYGDGTINDWNLNPVLTHRFSPQFKATARFYTTQYKTNTSLRRQKDDSLTYQDNFKQWFTRYESVGEYFFNERNITTVGVGLINESVVTSRYADGKEESQQTKYAFFQHEWLPLKQVSLIAGGRYDYNSIYGDQFSPKLSIRGEVSKRVILKGSFGFGFKSPDFRQLYFNFNNQAAGGYSVLGTEVIKERLGDFQAQGLIRDYIYDPSQLGKLSAERSLAFNVGGKFELLPSLWWNVNFFRNTIDNLIETQLVAVTTANQNIYSYRNIRRALMEGIESDFSYPLASTVSLSLGYQLLFALDRDVLNAVKAGLVYWRDPNTLDTHALKSSEYFGLYNRSRHSGNFKIFYREPKQKVEASLRVIYRGPFGVGDITGSIQGTTIPPADINGNGILDVYDSFVPGYALVNTSVAKTFDNNLRLQVGVDNLFNYTNPTYIPNLPGRLWYASVSYTISKSTKSVSN